MILALSHPDAEPPWDDAQQLVHDVDPACGFRERMGVRCLSEVPGHPLPALLVGHLDAEGRTIVYGTGRVGKGVWASCLVEKSADAGPQVLAALELKRSREAAEPLEADEAPSRG